jgi:hypothetical protein
MTVKLINNFKTFNDMSRPKWLDKRRGKLNLRRQIGVTFLESAREGGGANKRWRYLLAVSSHYAKGVQNVQDGGPLWTISTFVSQ